MWFSRVPSGGFTEILMVRGQLLGILCLLRERGPVGPDHRPS